MCETQRLRIRHLTLDDDAFMLALLNDESFIANIADRGVRTLEAAVDHIRNGPLASYEANGYGICLVELKDTNTPIGTCGLLKRDMFADADLGYAFLPAFRGGGYAYEAAQGVMTCAKTIFAMDRVIAITKPSNAGSIRLLEKLGFKYSKPILFTEGGPEDSLYECLLD